MGDAAPSRPRAFSVGFRDLQTWSVAAQFAVNWNWPDEAIKPLSSILSRRNEAALETLAPEFMVTLLTIRFDGSIEPREPVRIRDMKGRLFRVHPGDVVFSKIDVRNGAIGLAPDDIDRMCVTSEFPVYSVDFKTTDPGYVKLLFRTAAFKKILNSMISGASGRKRIQPTQLEAVKVPIPPLPIQQRIVARWEAANSNAHADMIASQELAKSTPSLLVAKVGLKALVSPHSRRAFVSSWNEIERWGVELAREMSRRPNIEISPFPVVSLSDVIADLQNGWSPKCLTRPATGDEWGVLKVGAVSFGWFDANQNKALPPSLKPRKQYEVKPGDLIFSRANIARYVGACALVDTVQPKLMLCDKLFRVVWKVKSPVLPKYLDEILKIPHLRWQIENSLTGASPTMKNISKPALMALRFPLPPLGIQEEIISEIERMRIKARDLLDDARISQKQAGVEIEKMILGTRPVEAH